MVVSRHVHALLIGAALIASTAARADDVSPEQKIALMAKPAVVRVMGAYVAKYSIGGSSVMTVAIGGSGTGWFITPDGYIATNAHVVEDIKDGESAAKDALAKEFLRELEQQSRGALSRMSAAERQQLLGMVQLVDLKKMVYVVLQNGDQLDYDVKQFGKPGTGKDCAILKVKTQNAPTLPIGDSNLTQVEDRVVVIGYPGVADQKELLDHNSQLQPSITDGAISALKKSSEGDPILQTSVPITHGNSGGPAIDQHGNVIGLATFGTDVQGFNFLVASVTLQDFIKNASVEPKQGDTDKAWRDGLEHFWAEEYTDAIKDFEEVETLYPQHAEAPRLITLSHQAQKDGKEKKSGAGVGAIVGAIVGIVALVGVIAFVLTRKKQPAQMRPPMPGQPMPGQPMPGQPMPGQPMQQMYGRAPAAAQGGPAQVPKTVAIQQQPGGSGGYAPTAFVSQAIGSLQCTRGRLMGQRFALTATGIIVGRQPGVAHVLIDDQRASGKHVWIGMENGRLVAIDQGTTNGTYVNDIARGRISRAELRDGDIVIVSEPDCLSLQVRLG